MNLQKQLSISLKTKIRRLYTDEKGTVVARNRNTIINWGCSSLPDRLRGAGRLINKPERVADAANKLITFRKLSEGGDRISYPAFTDSYETACEWVREGTVVVCRTKLNGHSGAGIVVAAREEDVVKTAPLYTKYIKKASEFRVHVAFGEVIDVQAKRKRTEYEGEVDYAIRNHHTGWVYCREDIVEPEKLREYAVNTILILGLDFGAVDIIYNKHFNQCYVLEVNTAPGLEGTSVTNYTEAFKKFVQG